MRPITFLVPDLGHSSHAKQVSLLAAAAKNAGKPATVFSLAGAGPFAHTLRQAGIAIEGHQGRRFFDIDDFLTLRRRMVENRDGLLHVFGLSPLRIVSLAGIGVKRGEVTLTLTGREKLRRLDRRWVNRVQRIEVPHEHARNNLLAQDVSATLVHIVPPKVAQAPPPPDREEFCREIGIPSDVPLLMTAGQMRDDALYEAPWAFEFLRYPEATARLLIMGDGPGREKIEAVAYGLAPDGSRALFLGTRTDVPSVLGLADLVLVPHPTGGMNVALEAMAAGRAVIARNSPDLSSVIRHNETGLLLEGGAPAEIARHALRLLHDPARRDALGKAAQAAVADRIIG